MGVCQLSVRLRLRACIIEPSLYRTLSTLARHSSRFRLHQPPCTPHTDYWPVCHPLKGETSHRRYTPARSMDRLPMTHSETPLPHRPGTELAAREREDRSAEYVFVLLYHRWLLRTKCADCVSQAFPLMHTRPYLHSLIPVKLDLPKFSLRTLAGSSSSDFPTVVPRFGAVASLDVTFQRCQCA